MIDPRPFPDRVIGRCADGFTALAARPGLLLATAFALQAVFMPYSGIYHDTELYAGQVVNAGSGRHADDLFFRYGGQTNYTLLPQLLSRPAVWFGVEPVFFAAYLACTAVRLWATQLLVFRLLGPTPIAAAGVLLDAVVRIPLGFESTFLVNEPFFTARSAAVALSVFGLERALAGRPVVAALLLLVAGATHPLIAAPAAAVAAVWGGWVWGTTPWRRAFVLGCWVVIGTAAVAYLVATAGRLDPEWRQLILSKCELLNPLMWPAQDWVRHGVAIACAAAAATTLGRSNRLFIIAVIAAGVAGVFAEVIAAHGSWLLLLQGQPFRAVWPMELLRLPLGLAVVARLWDGGSARQLGAITLAALLLAAGDLMRPISIVFVAVGLGIGAFTTRRVAAGPRAPWVAAVALVVWVVAHYGLVVTVPMLRELDGPAFARLGYGDVLRVLGELYGPLPRATVALGLVTLIVRFTPHPTAVAACGLCVAAATYMVPRTEPVAAMIGHQHRDTQFVRTILGDRWARSNAPVVYWPRAHVSTVWLDLRANSYFSNSQLHGIAFSRETAVEGDRRQRLVHVFEVDQFWRDEGSRGDVPTPTADDFNRLVAEREIDFLILTIDFGGAVATNGSVWVYDCCELRATRPR